MDESSKNNESSQEERKNFEEKVSGELNVDSQKIKENEVKEDVKQNDIKEDKDNEEKEEENLNQECLNDKIDEMKRKTTKESHDKIKMDRPIKEVIKMKKNHMKIAVVCLLFLILIVSIYGVVSIKANIGKTKVQKWEYKTIMVGPTEQNARTGNGAAKFNTINISEETLNELGNEGWELIDSYLEMETSYPNFGNNEYVTGLQSNVRPQLIKLIFKRSVVE